MAYTILKSDGTVLLTLADSTVDQLSTSLSLIGRNVDSYGEYWNNNLISLMENFSSEYEPRAPITGQLWFNKNDGRIYVYGLNSLFAPIVGTVVANTEPTDFKEGDIWIDSTNNQLYFSPDGISFVLAGPPSAATGVKNGWYVETITDNAGDPYLFAVLYQNDILLGIASASSYTFLTSYHGMDGVEPGFNLNTSINGIRFVGTATSVDSVSGFSPGDYLVRDVNETTTGSFAVLNNSGLYVGSSNNIHLYIDSSNTATIRHSIADNPFKIQGLNSVNGFFTPFYVDANNQRVGIFTESPSYAVDVVGDMQITGNLYVSGTTTNIETSNLQINDKNIELAYGQGSPSDTFANGGGITLIGSTNHTITWTSSSGGAWQMNDDLDLTSSSFAYKINGTSVLTSSTLGTGITSAPGLTSAPAINTIGVLTRLTVTNVTISGSTISSTGSNVTLYLNATGSGTIDVSGKKITNVGTPSSSTDAANKNYVDTVIGLYSPTILSLTIDITGMSNPADDVIPYLTATFPVVTLGLRGDTIARVLCMERSAISIPSTPLNLTQTKVGGVVTDVAGSTNTTSTTYTVTYTKVIPYTIDGSNNWVAGTPINL